MTSDEFCYWLRGFFELSEAEQLSPKQVEVIKNHLDLVFEKRADKRKDVQVPGDLKDWQLDLCEPGTHRKVC